MTSTDETRSWIPRLTVVSRDAARATMRVDWTQAQARDALVCLPTIVAALFVAIALHRPTDAIMAAGGAVSVGFGASQRLTRFRAMPMLLAAFGMAVFTWVGSVTVGRPIWVTSIVAAICSFAFGVLTTLGVGAWWVGLQWIIALFVFGSHPAGVRDAAWRTALVLLGGLTQMMMILIAWGARRQALFDPPSTGLQPRSRMRLWRTFRRALSPGTPRGRYALRVAITLTLADLIYRLWGIPNGYWIPMTAAILLKPDFYDTVARSLGRLAGTFVGAAIATIINQALRPTPMMLGVLVIAAVWACFALQKVNYAAFAACITAYVIFLLSLAGLPGPQVAIHRAEATIVGGALAMIAHSLPLRRRSSASQTAISDR